MNIESTISLTMQIRHMLLPFYNYYGKYQIMSGPVIEIVLRFSFSSNGVHALKRVSATSKFHSRGPNHLCADKF